MMLRVSQYNISIPVETGILLYNARTGASRQFAGSDAEELVETLCQFPASITETELKPQLTASLVEGGFLVDSTFDEIMYIRDVYRNARENSSIIITITTTNNCNLGCFYCFQSRSKEQINLYDTDKIKDHIRDILIRSGKRSVHVDWYGGEPMLNKNFIEQCSMSIQNMCIIDGISYSSSMLTNGTLWPDDSISFVRRHKIRRIQITFDGMSSSHNKTRHYRPGYSGVDQFEAASNLVSHLKNETVVDVRFNISPKNLKEVESFAICAKEKGWFSEGSKVSLQLAKITPYSKDVEFLRKMEVEYREFEEVRDKIRLIVPSHFLDRTANLDRYPYPRDSVCAAIAKDSVVIGADGKTYNCGLQVTEKHRSVGNLIGESDEKSQEQVKWWNDFDPTKSSTCSKCTFLPLCWGACPKLHLENNRTSLDEQSEFWKVMLPRRLSSSLGLALRSGFKLTERDQFKIGI